MHDSSAIILRNQNIVRILHSGVASLYSVMVFLFLIMLDSVLDPLDVLCMNKKGTRDESGIPKDLGYNILVLIVSG